MADSLPPPPPPPPPPPLSPYQPGIPAWGYPPWPYHLPPYPAQQMATPPYWVGRPLGPRAPGRVETWMRECAQQLSPRAKVAWSPIVIAAAIGLTTAVVFAGGIGGIGVLLVAAVVALALVATGTVRRVEAVAALVAGLALAALWLVRVSAWVQVPSVIGAFICLGAAVSFGRRGSLFSVSWTDVTTRAMALVGHAVFAPMWIVRRIADHRPFARVPRPRHLVRAVIIAAPLVGCLAYLLASADPLFANLFNIQVDWQLIVLYGSLFVLGSWAGLTLLRTRLAETLVPPANWSKLQLRRLDTVILLGGITVVFAAFVITQVVAAFGAGRGVLVQDGISLSSYARSGYFQLCEVVVLTSILLIAVHALTLSDVRGSRTVRGLSLIIVGLTLGIAWVAIQRIALYDETYGLTMLRLGSMVSAYWMVGALLIIALYIAGVASNRHWLPGAVALSFMVLILGVGAMNPDAYVASYNLDHARTIPLDVAYLVTLSDDAVPTEVAALPTLSANQAAALRAALCAHSAASGGWAQWNGSSEAATRSLVGICPGQP